MFLITKFNSLFILLVFCASMLSANSDSRKLHGTPDYATADSVLFEDQLKRFPSKLKIKSYAKNSTEANLLDYSLSPAKQEWRICVLLPNVYDQYWWSVNYGLQIAQKKLKVNLVIKEAGGYTNLAAQKNQMLNCINQKAQAIVISAISSKGLNAEIKMAKKKNIVVIDLINGIESSLLDARAVVSFKDMANMILDRALKFRQSGDKNFKLLWLPGPSGAGWVEDADHLIKNKVKSNSIELIHAGFAPTQAGDQRAIIEKIKARDDIDLIIANAVGAQVSARMFSAMKKKVPVFSYYFSNQIIREILKSKIDSAPTDFPIIQAVLAVDLAIKKLEKMEVAFQLSPIIEIIDHSRIYQLEQDFVVHPSWFRYSLKDKF